MVVKPYTIVVSYDSVDDKISAAGGLSVLIL